MPSPNRVSPPHSLASIHVYDNINSRETIFTEVLLLCRQKIVILCIEMHKP